MVICSNKWYIIQITGGNSIVKTIDYLLDEFKEYSDLHGKIRRDVKNGLIFRLLEVYTKQTRKLQDCYYHQ